MNCTIATDATLEGRPTTALPTDGPQPISVLEQQFGARFSSPTTIDSIEQQMLSSGDGSRGIVFGAREPGQAGHVFNVVNQNGEIVFLDGQTGSVADTTGFASFRLLRTNK